MHCVFKNHYNKVLCDHIFNIDSVVSNLHQGSIYIPYGFKKYLKKSNSCPSRLAAVTSADYECVLKINKHFCTIANFPNTESNKWNFGNMAGAYISFPI